MDHLHIARVLDGGTTDTGLPFFVMELVRGVPITEYRLHSTVFRRLKPLHKFKVHSVPSLLLASLARTEQVLMAILRELRDKRAAA